MRAIKLVYIITKKNVFFLLEKAILLVKMNENDYKCSFVKYL